jgi:hydroxylysine kinase
MVAKAGHQLIREAQRLDKGQHPGRDSSGAISGNSDSAVIADVQHVLRQDYGLEAELSRLPGENLNFLVLLSNGEKYVAKISADDQSEAFVEMEYLALRQAAGALPDLALPQILPNRKGEIETCLSTSGNSSKRLRLINFLQGELLEHCNISDQVLNSLGAALGHFDLALRQFDHPAAHRSHRWNLSQAGQYQATVELVHETQSRELLAWAFEQYTKGIAGKLNRVIWQFIHGDANPENILVQGDRVVGLLDFGDSCHNPRVCELAICLPYLMMDRQDPLEVATRVVDAYAAVNPLQALERELLWPLLLGRVATTISVATQRRQVDPNHPNWFVSEAKAWRLLKQLRELPTLRL